MRGIKSDVGVGAEAGAMGGRYVGSSLCCKPVTIEPHMEEAIKVPLRAGSQRDSVGLGSKRKTCKGPES